MAWPSSVGDAPAVVAVGSGPALALGVTPGVAMCFSKDFANLVDKTVGTHMGGGGVRGCSGADSVRFGFSPCNPNDLPLPLFEGECGRRLQG